MHAQITQCTRSRWHELCEELHFSAYTSVDTLQELQSEMLRWLEESPNVSQRLC